MINETLSRDELNEIELEIALKSRAESISILVTAINDGIETLEEYELLSNECDSLPEFDPEDPEEFPMIPPQVNGATFKALGRR